MKHFTPPSGRERSDDPSAGGVVVDRLLNNELSVVAAGSDTRNMPVTAADTVSAEASDNRALKAESTESSRCLPLQEGRCAGCEDEAVAMSSCRSRKVTQECKRGRNRGNNDEAPHSAATLPGLCNGCVRAPLSPPVLHPANARGTSCPTAV